MPFLQKSLSTQTKWQIVLVSAAIVGITALLAWDVSVGGPLTSLFLNRDEITELVRSATVLGPLIFVLIYILSVIIAPVPSPAVAIAGGYIFGWWGILWSLIGSFVGFYLVFAATRKFGRPFVEKILKKEALHRYDTLLGKGDGALVFILFLLPIFPDGFLAYLSGLTKLSIRDLMWMAMLGRIPGAILSIYVGKSLDDANYWSVAFAAVTLTVLTVLVYFKRDNLLNWARKTFKKKHEE